MAKRISSLKGGESVTLKFHGSKQFGNDPYELDVTFVGFFNESDEKRARFDYGDGTTFDAYRYANRWSYGTSAERLSIAS
jgi:hypothetical protein